MANKTGCTVYVPLTDGPIKIHAVRTIGENEVFLVNAALADVKLTEKYANFAENNGFSRLIKRGEGHSIVLTGGLETGESWGMPLAIGNWLNLVSRKVASDGEDLYVFSTGAVDTELHLIPRRDNYKFLKKFEELKKEDDFAKILDRLIILAPSGTPEEDIRNIKKQHPSLFIRSVTSVEDAIKYINEFYVTLHGEKAGSDVIPLVGKGTPKSKQKENNYEYEGVVEIARRVAELIAKRRKATLIYNNLMDQDAHWLHPYDDEISDIHVELLDNIAKYGRASDLRCDICDKYMSERKNLQLKLNRLKAARNQAHAQAFADIPILEDYLRRIVLELFAQTNKLLKIYDISVFDILGDKSKEKAAPYFERLNQRISETGQFEYKSPSADVQFFLDMQNQNGPLGEPRISSNLSQFFDFLNVRLSDQISREPVSYGAREQIEKIVSETNMTGFRYQIEYPRQIQPTVSLEELHDLGGNFFDVLESSLVYTLFSFSGFLRLVSGLSHHGEEGDNARPDLERVNWNLYKQHLVAGVDSGTDEIISYLLDNNEMSPKPEIEFEEYVERSPNEEDYLNDLENEYGIIQMSGLSKSLCTCKIDVILSH